MLGKCWENAGKCWERSTRNGREMLEKIIHVEHWWNMVKLVALDDVLKLENLRENYGTPGKKAADNMMR